MSLRYTLGTRNVDGIVTRTVGVTIPGYKPNDRNAARAKRIAADRISRFSPGTKPSDIGIVRVARI